ncbi:UNKNOWN [Stylonychia lemnae]|uniref:Uncharacterized protein n=1 Tax=Stylonychia lemnae TaxID=5949 RepID=A0A077ZNZ7_STYLE|nr:UNKNOWN [Stylonychia lemnae]|eukprot:CDW71189.1 UNKNOWN [Stylonychia lemnae]
MGFFKKFFQIITCGIGPWVWDKIKQKLGFAKWTLRWQIFCSVNLNFLVDSTYEKLDSEIMSIYSQNLNDLGVESSLSIELMGQISQQLLEKSRMMTQEIINPVVFSPYPLNIQTTKLYTTKEATFDSQGLDYDHMVYYTEQSQFAQLNAQTQNYIRAISTLNSYWKKLILTRVGRDSDINISRIFIMLQSNTTSGLCENVLFLYPAQQNVNLGNASSLGGCTAQLNQFGKIWSQTLAKNNFTSFPKIKDPFGNSIFGDITTYTQVIWNQGKAGTNPIGIIGLQYKISVFKSLIDPLVMQGPKSYYLIHRPDSNGKINQNNLVVSNINNDIIIPDELYTNVTDTLRTEYDYTNLGSINGEMYRVYRCQNPINDTQNPNYVIVMIQSISSTSKYSDELWDEIQSQFRNLLYIVFGCSILLFFSIWILILRFTKRITHPINQLTRITDIIKQATGREGREKVLSVIENEPIFEKTKKLLKQEQALNESRRQTQSIKLQSRKETYARSQYNTIVGSDVMGSMTQSLIQNNGLKELKKEKLTEGLESLDEIQELLKIFYKFFVGNRTKPKPQNQENQPKYYKNNYYQPQLYQQSLLEPRAQQDLSHPQNGNNFTGKQSTRTTARKNLIEQDYDENDENSDLPNARNKLGLKIAFHEDQFQHLPNNSKVHAGINDSLISNQNHLNAMVDEDQISMNDSHDSQADDDAFDEDDEMDVETRMNMKKNPKTKNIDQQITGQFSFGKSKGNIPIDQAPQPLLQDDNNDRVRVTIPIDWDDIIERYIDQISQQDQADHRMINNKNLKNTSDIKSQQQQQQDSDSDY